MHPDPHPYEPLQETNPGKPRRVPRVAVAVGLTAFLGLAGAGLAFAVGGSGTPGTALSSSTSSTTSVPKSVRPHIGHGAGPMLGLGRGLGRVLHGEYTIDEGGTYKTIAVQTGMVTAVSCTSISVQSTDNLVQTYAVQPSTVVDSQANGISTVQKGDTVNVQAVVQNSSRTATNIVDVTKVGASRKGFGFMPGAPGGGPGGSGGAPPASSSAAT